jgi:hypothetical protein
MARRAEQQRSDVAIIRMERLYPLPVRTLPEALAAMPQAQVRWVQEEPANQGAWPFMALNLPQVIDRPLQAISRPAIELACQCGTDHRHEAEQRLLVDQAFASGGQPDVLHRSRNRGVAAAPRRRPGQPGLAGRAAARVHRPAPQFDSAVDRLATWLARLDDADDAEDLDVDAP